MKIFPILFISVSMIFFCRADGFSFRCGSGLVTTGDLKIQVLETCGQPSSKEVICPRITSACPSTIEIWHYNCGSNDFLYGLTFENGKLSREENEGRGSGKSNCPGK